MDIPRPFWPRRQKNELEKVEEKPRQRKRKKRSKKKMQKPENESQTGHGRF